jgi:hypothetical protein
VQVELDDLVTGSRAGVADPDRYRELPVGRHLLVADAEVVHFERRV